jgi:hypothetical protein
MNIKFKPPGGTLGLSLMTGDSVIDWDLYFRQNFDKIDTFVGTMAKNWPTLGVTAGLSVSAGTGMTISVSVGGAVIQGHFFSLDTAQSLTVLPADPTYNRIDLVVVRLDWVSGDMSLAIVKGNAANVYAAAQPTTNDTTWEIPLAEIAVNTRVTSILAANITDKRFYVPSPVASSSSPETTWGGLPGMSGWSNYGVPYNSLQYKRDAANFVVIRGLVQGGSASTQITVLPDGFRPLKTYSFPVVTLSGFARIDVKADGSVWLNGSFSSFLFLDGIRFALS